ncbi:hypothetical protein [Phaeobacter porticola]|uniref:Uncharacterized protein n=1 Tax=Phaeobacter porticola TaxID=1844006 RepID=A0A1L3I2Z8_9RHOB|nr:hypothetical protein [Phaeobacter porticola]APG46500.1 hypothetical protein PhaeoP97_01073 [Phaeobacter porticola]
MFVIGALLFGVLLGAYSAKKRGGSLADILQYGAVYGIGFAIVGLIATIIIHRMAL